MFKNTYIMQSLNLWNFVIIGVYNADNSTGECQITYSRGTRNWNFLLPHKIYLVYSWILFIPYDTDATIGNQT